MNASKFMRKNLQGYVEKNGYCSGKYVGSVTNLVEGYMAVTSSVFRRVSAHHRGASKRLKQNPSKGRNLWFSHQNSLIPIPFNGCIFEIIGTETWNCSFGADKKIDESSHSWRKRSGERGSKCPASINIRTVKVYTDFMIKNDGNSSENKKKQDNVKHALLEKLKKGEELAHKVVCYCRFPLNEAHLTHDPTLMDVSSNRLDRRVASKIKQFAKSGIYDIDNMQLMLADYVRSTLFGHGEPDELPHPQNTRYFPTKRVIHNHIVAAVGPMKRLHLNALNSIQNTPVVMEIFPDQDSAMHSDLSSSGVGLIAIHVGAGYHSDQRWPGYQRLCDEACWLAMTCLKEGGNAGEAVTIAVKVLEDSEFTNAGFGSNLTENGNIECDASVMDASLTKDGCPKFGAVSGVSCIKNPVCAAYLVAKQQVDQPRLTLGRIPPCSLSGVGAEKWATAHRVEMCEKRALVSESAQNTWQKYSRKLFEALSGRQEQDGDFNEHQSSLSQRFDTVGAIAIDIHGKVASAASSGGIWMKLPGRVGQAAMYGCGCWAESGNDSKPSVAVTTSGCGEQLMYAMTAKKCSENLQNHEEPYTAVQETLLNDFLDSTFLKEEYDKHAGILALHHSRDESHSITELVWGHTTSSMIVAHMSTKDFKPEVILSRLPDSATSGKSLSVSGTWLKVAIENTNPFVASNADLFSSAQSSQDDSSPYDVLPQTPANTDHISPQTSAMSQVDGAYDNLSLDEDIKLMYMSCDVKGLSMDRCFVNLSDSFNRKIDEEFENKIATRWEERRKQNPRLFNALKFRIDSLKDDGETLTFNLGLTCYRDYMETNWSVDVKYLTEKGRCEYNNTQAYLSEPLGVAGVVITTDNKVIFQRRNHWLAEGAGLLDVPGGHPEPAEAAKVSGNMGLEMSQLMACDVIEEIFTSQLKEVRDEVNIPLERLSESRLIGLVRNNLSAGRPVCYFVIKCCLSSNQIQDLYRKGGPETDESTQLVFLYEKELVYLERDSPTFWSDLCPNGKAAVTLYSILKQKQNGETPFQLR